MLQSMRHKDSDMTELLNRMDCEKRKKSCLFVGKEMSLLFNTLSRFVPWTERRPNQSKLK